MAFRLKGWLFFLSLILIGFGFSLVTQIPLAQRFLQRSGRFRVGGLLFLAMLSFLTCLALSSRFYAEFSFWYVTELAVYPFNEGMDFSSPNAFLEWAIPNKPSIIKEMWINNLTLALSKDMCFSSDPMVCMLVQRTRFLRESLPFFYTVALIPALITFSFGWRIIRRVSIIDFDHSES